MAKLTVSELNKEQIIQLKQAYLTEISDEGTFSEITGLPYDTPSQNDMINADDLVPDDIIYEKYNNTVFSEDDFWR